jgi:hypothetical protein
MLNYNACFSSAYEVREINGQFGSHDCVHLVTSGNVVQASSPPPPPHRSTVKDLFWVRNVLHFADLI